MNITKKLNVLDFSPGIRASYINENFDLVKQWIDQERLRVSGWGLVDGFELSYDRTNYTVTVSDGVMVNTKGEQLEIQGETFDGRDLNPEYGLCPFPIKCKNKNLTIKDNIITLQYPIYSEETKSIVYTNGDMPNDLVIINVNTGDRILSSQIRSIAANKIVFVESLNSVSVDIEYVTYSYEQKLNEIDVQHLYANDRIDGIFIRKDASPYSNGSMFRYHMGYSTDTPTCTEDEYVIGYAYWHVGKNIEVEFITSDRSYRQVYVDKKGVLWLMGKPYEGYKFILFKEEEKEYDEETGRIKEKFNYPAGNPTSKEYDLWYDIDENILKVYRKNEDGKLGWFPVNDLAKFKREIRFYTADEFPDDLQTFDFTKSGDLNLQFVPGQHQLTVIIDQIVLMDDQIIELYDKRDTSKASGYGFKLAEPLDRATVVEVRVDHNAYRTEDYYKDLFEKIACFVYDNTINIAENTHGNTYFKLDAEYQPNDRQLEVWINGVKQLRGIDFNEARFSGVRYDSVIVGEIENANAVKIIKPLKEGDTVYYKISRYMSSYANFKSAIKDIEDKENSFEERINEKIDEHINEYLEHKNKSEKNDSALSNRLSQIEEDYRKKSEAITQKDLAKELSEKIAHKILKKENKTTVDCIIEGSISDFYYVIWAKDDERYPLIRDYDYFVDADEENTVSISLTDNWKSSKAKIYIEKIPLSEA